MPDNYGPNRYVCTVLEEMRDHLKRLGHLNLYKYKQMQSMMLEEVQTLVNRMESALGDWSDYKKMMEERAVLKREIMKLRARRDELKKDTDE